MSAIYVALIIVLVWLLYVAAVTWCWWGVSRANKKFNRVRGRALVRGLVRSGCLQRGFIFPRHQCDLQAGPIDESADRVVFVYRSPLLRGGGR